MIVNRYRQIAIHSAQVFLIFFPLSLAVLVQIRELASVSSTYSFLMTIPIVLSLNAYLAYLTQNQTTTRTKQIIEILLVLGTLLSIRLILLAIFSSNVESDFWDIHRFAVDLATGQGTANTQNYTFIPRVTYLNMMAEFLSYFYRIFGPSIRTGKLIMVSLSVLTGLTIYLIARLTWKNHAAGLISALIFTVWPSLIVYTGMTTPDHVAILLICFVFLTYNFIDLPNKQVKEFIPLLILLATLCGLVDWFRPIGIILVIASILSDLFLSDLRFRHQKFLLIGRVISFFVIYSLVSNLSLIISEKKYNIRLPASNQGIGESLYIGLNPQTGGMFSQDDFAVIIQNQRTFGDNFAAANHVMVNKALERFTAYRSELPQLLLSKFNRVWANHDQLFEFALNGSNDQELAGYLKIFDAVFTPTIFLCVLISVASSLFIRPTRVIFTMQLMILGLGLLLLVTEVQNRYHLVVVPVLVILAAHGYSCLAGWLVKFSASIRQLRANSIHTTGQK